MKHEEVHPKKFVSSVTVKEVLVSAGIQLLHWANDIAFTDAAFGEDWCVETANRMATISEILNVLYYSLPKGALSIVIDLPDGVIGQIITNPDYVPDAEKPSSEEKGDSDSLGGMDSSIDDLPF
jgi:hypothetical protein